MKILGWMHRKLMHNSNSIDQIKNPTIAATTLSLHTPFHEQNYFMRPTSRLSNSNSSTYSDSTAKFEEEEESFDFLSIGTFGVELLNTEPPTPTLPIEDQPMEITESDLDLINQELEKFLDAEETELNNDHASQRSSHASIITLSYKAGGESEGHVHMAAACPLQNYLLAASVEVVETEKEGKKERASLGELFKRSNVIREDDEAVMKKSCEHHQSRKGNVAHFVKKVVNKFNSSSSSSDTAPTKNKLSKTIVKMFNKKVYPEEMTEKQFMKLAKSRNRSISHEDTHTGSEPKKSKKKTIKLSFAGICRGASPVNAAGHWIKTDSDYLVLEL